MLNLSVQCTLSDAIIDLGLQFSAALQHAIQRSLFALRPPARRQRIPKLYAFGVRKFFAYCSPPMVATVRAEWPSATCSDLQAPSASAVAKFFRPICASNSLASGLIEVLVFSAFSYWSRNAAHILLEKKNERARKTDQKFAINS